MYPRSESFSSPSKNGRIAVQAWRDLSTMARQERERHCAWRVTWFLVIGLSLGAFSGQCYQLIYDYFRYDTSVFVDISLQQYLHFPAITICNKNMAKYGKINHNPSWLVYAGDKSARGPGREPPPPPPPDGGGGPGGGGPGGGDPPPPPPPTGDPPPPVRACTNASDLECVVEMLGQDAQYVRRQLLITGLERDLSSEEKINVSYSFKELVIQCLWHGASCNKSDFRQTWIPGAGNCYTFNYDHENPLLTSIPGPLNGLTLILYANAKTYLPYLSESFGLRLVVHSPRDVPLPLEMGFDVPPSTETSLGLRVTDIIRQPPPFTTACYGEGGKADPRKNAFTEWYPQAEYSSRVCQATCLQSNLMSTCKCANPQIPSTGLAYENVTGEAATVNFCDYLNASDWECTNQVRSLLATNHHEYCSCPAKCKELLYTVMTSSSQWPTPDFKEYILPMINSALEEDEKTFHPNDVCKVNIYFEDLTVQLIHHTEGYTWTSLVSDLGGLLGLWLGLSILTLYEIVEILVVRLRHTRCGVGETNSVAVTGDEARAMGVRTS